MRIERRFKPWLVCARSDGGRLELAHVYVQGQYLFASNGFMMVATPVELGEKDVPGFLRADVLRYAAEKTSRKETHVEIRLAANMVQVTADGSWHRRTLASREPLRAPCFESVINQALAQVQQEDISHARMAFNPVLLHELAMALDAMKGVKCNLSRGVGRGVGPIWVRELDAAEKWGHWPRGPFGLLMPMHPTSWTTSVAPGYVPTFAEFENVGQDSLMEVEV